MNMKRYALFALAMLTIDWVLGVMHVTGVLPIWTFLIFNFPFGLGSVWIESHWAGTHYAFGGQNLNETWSLAAFFFAVFAQAWLYAVLFGRWQRRHSATLVS